MPSRLTVVLVSLLLVTPVVILWICLLILPTTVTIECPEECDCVLGGMAVNCSGSGLNSIPSILPTDVRQLLLDKNNLMYFENDSFVSKGLVELEILYIVFCELRTIELGAFNGLTKLIELSLMGNELSEIIPGTFEKISSLEHLDLSYNRIEHLESDVFSGLVNLNQIILQGNNLQYLHPDTFSGLPNLLTLGLSKNSVLQVPTDRHFFNSNSLKQLDISGCNIRSVSGETFANVSALDLLDLSENNFMSFDINLLKVLSNLSKLNLKHNEISEIIRGTGENYSRLGYLDLEDNKIEHLESDVFSGLVNLKLIVLQGNNLQNLHPDTFSGLPNLQSLFLSGNDGLQIPTDRHFINSRSLKELGMSFCNVRSVSVETFANVSALELLDLDSNNLKSVDINILKALPKLSTLYLFGNPLQCDCQLQEVWRWCQDHNIQTAYEDMAPECDTPSEVKGIWWGVLEKGRCIQGNITYYGDYKNTSYNGDITNNTDTEKEKFLNILKPYVLPVVAVLFIFGTTCNVILIIIITCNKDMRTVPNMYILNLTVGNLIILTSFFCIVCRYRIPNILPQDGIMCAFLPFHFRMMVGVTTYSIAVFSIQRYRVTLNPFKVLVSSQPTWRSTVATICGVWILAAIFALPIAEDGYLFCDSILLWLTDYYKILTIFHLLVFYVLPLCVIAFSYIITACHLFESYCSISEETQNPQLNTRRNTAQDLLGLTVVLLITYMPYHIYDIYMSFSINYDVSILEINDAIVRANDLGDIKVIFHILLSINSCLNPVALYCTSLAFRRHLKRYLTYCCNTNSPPINFDLTNTN